MNDLSNKIENLTPQRRALLEKLLAEKRKNKEAAQQPMIPRRETAESAPLSFAQQRLWLLEQLQPGNPAYHIPAAIRLNGQLNVAALEQSLQQIIHRHEILRTTFVLVDGKPTQYIAPNAPFALSNTNLQHIPPSEQEAVVLDSVRQEVVRPFDLANGPLLRAALFELQPQEHVLVVCLHHIVADDWSMGIFIQEMTTLYHGFVQGEPVALPPLPVQYGDFAAWQHHRFQGEAWEKLLTYWKTQLTGALPVLQMPADRPRPALQTFAGAKEPITLPAPLAQKLQQLSRQENVTLFTTLLAAFDLLLHTYTGQNDLIVGTPAASRPYVETESLIGFFVNTLVLRVDLSDKLTFRALLRHVHQVVTGAYTHQGLPFEKLVEEIQPARDLSRSPIFQAMFILRTAPKPSLALPGLETTFLTGTTVTAQVDLTLSLTEKPEGLTGSLEYNVDLFDQGTIGRFLHHFARLLEWVVQDPDRSITTLSLLTTVEQHQILEVWNNTAVSLPPLCVHHLLEAQAARTPNAVALVFGDQTLSYAQLHQQANQLAHTLQQLGAGPERLVGLYLDRSLEMVVGLLAVLKAGAAYVPLDPAHPAERLAFILADSAVSIILTQQTLLNSLPPHSAHVFCLDSGEETAVSQPSTPNPINLVQPDNLAYVIYTSGSTGRPKGVQVTHRGVVNFLRSMQQQPGVQAEDVLLAVTTLSFDIAVLELLLPLTVGARVVIASQETTKDASLLAAQIQKHHVTVMQATPATWRLLCQAGWPAQTSLKVLCGGEALPEVLAAELCQKAGSLWNLYGPTETTVWSAARAIHDPQKDVAIGHPIANTQLYILNNHLQPVPIGVVGELFIGGAGVTRGYLRRPGLTAEKFLPHLFSHIPGERLYRTGDVGRYRPDGTIEFLGRADHQVKIRGFRIELGEIEAALNQQTAVQEAIVLAREDAPGDKRLVAYLVAQAQPLPLNDLRRLLQTSLPEYMIPSHFVWLPALPLSPNGKIDRKALPAPDEARPQLETAYTAPRHETERLITEVWQAVLKVDRVGVHDNFFDLGGHSLLVVQVNQRLTQIFQRAIPMVDMFRYPTVAGLAAYLHPQETPQMDSAVLTAKQRVISREPIVEDRSIAIIGMAGRFPGAENLEQFWQNLCDGSVGISFFQEEELLAAGLDPRQVKHPNYVKARGIIPNIDQFDAQFFGFSAREAEMMDPQHRVFLECAWQALETAGYDAERYNGRIGVYAGSGMSAYLLNNLLNNPDYVETIGPFHLIINNGREYLATRIAYRLNLNGPAVTVQTACSTSLVAVHMACQSLLNGECEMALAGGITLGSPPVSGYLYEPESILSPDGLCRPFDAEAQGTVFGYGTGIVVLKRLADALADGDTIQAVIKASAINNDGARKIGYTAPSEEGQAEVITQAYTLAGVEPHTITYVEAHGTGTHLGDPIEVAALTRAFRAETEAKTFCALGSVKSNIGHLDAAAGVAGLIKTVLALKHGQIPPTAHFNTPHPAIDFANSPFYVNTAVIPWSANGTPRRAGVSSMGIGGTNAHLILEEAPPPTTPEPGRGKHLLLLSAKTEESLEQATQNLAAHLRAHPEQPLADVAYTLQLGRRPFSHRRFVVGDDPAALSLALETTDPQQVYTALAQARHQPIFFMFSGQGAQYIQMGHGLYQHEPFFREVVDRCATLLQPHLDVPLLQVLFPLPGDEPQATAQLNQTAVTQPALFVIEYALAQLWRHRGIRPQAMIGHSIGEYVAACLAGVFSLEDALLLVAARGRLMQTVPPGVMVSVPLSEPDIQPFLTEQLSIAALNSPSYTVVSGPETAVCQLESRLSAAHVEYRRLQTSHAFHSAMMQPILAAFADIVQKTNLHAPQIPYLSNLTGSWITAAQATDPAYWAQHLRCPVRFADGLQPLLAEPQAIFLEVGPGSPLATLTRQHPAKTADHLILSSLPHPQQAGTDQAFHLNTMGRLWLAGIEPTWSTLYANERRQRVPLPTYPFARTRFWVEPAKSGSGRPQTLSKNPDITNWFYMPAWKSSPLPTREPKETKECWLLFSDGGRFCTQLAKSLAAQGDRVVTVLAGGEFTAVHDTYTLRPAHAADYVELLHSLRQRQDMPTHIIHLWNLPSWDGGQGNFVEKALEASFYSLLFLAQSLGAQPVQPGLQLTVVSTQLHAITGQEEVQPLKATLLGPCKVIPQEMAGVACRAVDVVQPEPGSPQEKRLVEQLLAELEAELPDAVVAYRGAHRWVQTVEPAPLKGVKGGVGGKLRHQGVYLITGGLGGIGLALAQYLARAVAARLVLIGRSAFPSRGAWEKWLANHPADDPTSQQILAIQTMEAAGGQVLVVQADVSDEPQMKTAVSLAQETFGTINGVIHAAGLPGGDSIWSKTKEVASHTMAAKVQGTLVLHALFSKTNLDLFLLCSSIAATPGGVGSVDYCAANAFLDAFAHTQPSITSINWDVWAEVGMAAKNAESRWREVRDGILTHEGIEVFQRIIGRNQMPQLIVSTKHLPTVIQRLRELTAAPLLPEKESVHIPSTKHPRPRLQTTYVAPQTETEQKVAVIWQDLLGVEQIGIYDDFFELGGHSLLGIQIISRVRQQFQVELPLRAFFETPTVARVAATIEQTMQTQQPETEDMIVIEDFSL